MKKLLLTLVLLSGLSCFSQSEFEGMWFSKTSSYTTVIVASEYAVLSVHNFSFKEDAVIKEKILSKSKKTFKTSLHNESNGYSVSIDYVMIDNNTVKCIYEGDLSRVVYLKRLKTTKKTKKNEQPI